ncbi:gliding motility lipoprotein GldH [Carboxylicivirga caseinilyticus]|uniref:gliding motility lipoprotein GldH n=1 Tax=Carboxylicivirga caseinilyticus TaxID=3417572 RepID=UPI003D3251A6|nr:gliding motility lipoprotein GldH [Marinilabiliaceae bacterium A049]
MKVISQNSILLAIFLAIGFVSCDKNAVFDQYVTIPDAGWNKDSMAVFMVDIDNAQMNYNVYLNIRNRSEYPNSNLWLFVDVMSPSGKTMQQKVDCILADDNGRWLGSGWGDLFHVTVPYQMGVKFAEEGEYTFRIVQGMRTDDLTGIHNIGLRIEEAE